jgi:hypothetical protein
MCTCVAGWLSRHMIHQARTLNISCAVSPTKTFSGIYFPKHSVKFLLHAPNIQNAVNSSTCYEFVFSYINRGT